MGLIRESTFNLAYGTKAMVLAKIVLLIVWTQGYTKEVSDVGLQTSLDLIGEVKAKTHLWNLAYKHT